MLVLGFLLGTIPELSSSILPTEISKSLRRVKLALALIIAISSTLCISSAVLASHVTPTSSTIGFSDLIFVGLSTSLYCGLSFVLDETVDEPSELFDPQRRKFLGRVSSLAFAGWTLLLAMVRPGRTFGFSLLVRGITRACDYLVLYGLVSLKSSLQHGLMVQGFSVFNKYHNICHYHPNRRLRGWKRHSRHICWLKLW